MALPFRRISLLILAALVALPLGGWAQHAPAPADDRHVVVNGVRLSNEQVQALEGRYGVQVLDGDYWYDRASGAWGHAGGPTVGFIPAGLEVGGPLRADASGGTTGVFVNGRQLHVHDVLALQQLVGAVAPGRYWLDANGNVGLEGQGALLNLVVLAQRTQGGRGNTFYRSGNTDIGAGSSGGTSYVMGDGWSVTVGQ